MRAIFVLALCLHAAVSGSWINSGKYQGDVILTPHQERMLLNSTAAERNAIVDLTKRWPNNQVPYAYRDGVFSDAEKTKIQAAMDDYAKNTCIEFIERTSETDYIEFIKDGGCYSYWGRVGSAWQPQPVSLANGCVWNSIIIHELMHAIGFLHEQSRYDRDDYVIINEENIISGLENQFEKEDEGTIDLLDLPYDLKSVMHYSAYAFSSNGQPTIVGKDGSTDLGNNEGFTALDIEKVNKLYECTDTEATTTSATTTQATTTVTVATTTEDPSTEDPSTEDPSTEEPVSCEDFFEPLCSNMAGKGKCGQRSTMKFMHENCPKSCETCDGGCYDTYSQCKGFARKNYCEDDFYGVWMQHYCPYSCGFCSAK